MDTDIRILQIAERIGKAAHAQHVYLFGSYARGEARQDSDVDLMVVAESELPPHKRARELYRLVYPSPFPLDILVYTPSEVESERRATSSFVSHVLQEARAVYVG
jgi:uncharacterized protein